MAACVATREFLTVGGASPSESPPEGMKYLPVLLPPLCLNRYVCTCVCLQHIC